MGCEYCKDDDQTPCCWNGECEAPKNAQGISMCIHCGAEMLEVNGLWYHWSQFDNNGNLISPENQQSQEY